MAKTSGSLLLPHVSQYDVDFVIPRVGVDIPVWLDPFLLYKSRDPEFRRLHELTITAFNHGIDAVKRGEFDDAYRILDFPEESAVGFGYTKRGKAGSGVGSGTAKLLVKTIASSPGLQERKVRHVEEMQLLAARIGADRVSDIAVNILKQFLIDYTQRQAALWKLPLKSGVPISHVYDHEAADWIDTYADVPVDETNGQPILLVPRRLVRRLPWINYDDFLKTEFRAYLAARRGAPQRGRKRVAPAEAGGSQHKTEVVSVTRADVALIERYVRTKEKQSAGAKPDIDYIEENSCEQAESLLARLSALPSGREAARDYQFLVLEILNYVFNPDLTDGQPEVRTFDGTERRDIVFTNESDEAFWDYVRTSHDNIFVMFETKNTEDLDAAAVNQTATYLGDRVGRLGIIVTRQVPSEAMQRKMFSVWNDSSPRKTILTLADVHLQQLLELRCRNASPTAWMQKHYRAFRTSVQ